LICALCSKPVPPWTASTRAGERVVHIRCLARETGLRALDIQDRATTLLVRAERAQTEAATLRKPLAFVLVGRLTALGRATRRLTAGGTELVLARAVSLDGLDAGVRATVSGHRDGAVCIATAVVIRTGQGW